MGIADVDLSGSCECRCIREHRCTRAATAEPGGERRSPARGRATGAKIGKVEEFVNVTDPHQESCTPGRPLRPLAACWGSATGWG